MWHHRPQPISGGRPQRPGRREVLQIGGLGALGLGLPALLHGRQAQAAAAEAAQGKRARSCIVLFMLGAPPQHETWDPKPDAPAEIRGELGPIATSVPGLWVGELMPLVARRMERICVLRGVSTGDNAHSTSGYAMCTGVPHVPLGVEGAAPGAPNDWPSLGAVVKHLTPPGAALPAAITLTEVAANDGNKTWPGQDGGFLGRGADPWILAGDPDKPDFQVQDLVPPGGVDNLRTLERLSLLEQLDRRIAAAERNSATGRFAVWQQQALDLMASPAARRAFDLNQETPATRDRYGRTKFGQCALLARRLVEAGVGLVQLNWPRVERGLNNGHWDTHSKNAEALRTVLMPRMDQAYAALLDDLAERGLLDETLVVWMGEFGRTPKINSNGGRDHWGAVFSVALSGGGVRGGQVFGSSDRLGAEPKSGRVQPADLAATIFHQLGFPPETEIRNTSGRPLPISRGEVIRQIL